MPGVPTGRNASSLGAGVRDFPHVSLGRQAGVAESSRCQLYVMLCKTEFQRDLAQQPSSGQGGWAARQCVNSTESALEVHRRSALSAPGTEPESWEALSPRFQH